MSGSVIPRALRKHLTKAQQRLWLLDTIEKVEKSIREERNGWGMPLGKTAVTGAKHRLGDLKRELARMDGGLVE